MLSNDYLSQEIPLFKECLEALGVGMLPNEEARRLSHLFDKIFPITDWGKVDWEKINNKVDIGYEPENIIPSLEKILLKPIDTSVYIEWSSASFRVIQADLRRVVEVFDYVTCVSFEKFIFNLNTGYIIEVLPSYQMTAGVVPLWDKIKSM